MIVSADEQARFDRLRKRTMDAIRYELSIDPYCKSSEGTFEVQFCFPDYFADNDGERGPDFVIIKLYCYVLGPSRHYEWKGPTFLDALWKAEAEIGSWIEAQHGDS